MYLHLNPERDQAAQIAEILRGPKPAPTEPGSGLARAVEAIKKCATLAPAAAESKEGAQ